MSRKRKYEQLYSEAAATASIEKMIYNLTGSVFRWKNLPPNATPGSEMMEVLLAKHGALAAFSTNIGLQILPFVNKGVNQWGLPAEGSVEPIIVSSLVPIVHTREHEPIVLYDQPNHEPIRDTLEWYIDALGKLRQAIDTSTRWLKTPMLFIGKEEQREVIYDLVRKIEQGIPAVGIAEGSINIEGIQLTPTNITPAILQALHESYARIEGALLEELGVPDYNSSKMAQQTHTEIILPMLAVALKTMARLDMRYEFLGELNHIYGSNTTVECLSLGLIQQSIFSSTGHIVNLQDLNQNGIPDKVEGGGVDA